MGQSKKKGKFVYEVRTYHNTPQPTQHMGSLQMWSWPPVLQAARCSGCHSVPPEQSWHPLLLGDHTVELCIPTKEKRHNIKCLLSLSSFTIINN